jgi:hypothetical protein
MATKKPIEHQTALPTESLFVREMVVFIGDNDNGECECESHDGRCSEYGSNLA